jgi:hypothetical protein
MRMKTFITLLLGLAFQLAQVLPGVRVGAPCAAPEAACECCAAGGTCCCMTSEQPAPKPAPLPLQNAGFLKAMAMKAAETQVSAVPWHGSGLPALLAVALPSAPPGGYTGVRLAVAYCSFVI